MENSKIAFVEGENMTLCETDNSTSTESTMQNEETMMEKPSQPMDIEEEVGNDDDILVPLRTLMDIDMVGPDHTLSTETASPIAFVESSTERHQSRKVRGPYRRYSASRVYGNTLSSGIQDLFLCEIFNIHEFFFFSFI